MSQIRAYDIEKVYTDTRKFYLGEEVEFETGVYIFLLYNDLSGEGSSDALWAVQLDSAYGHFEVSCDSDHADACCDLPMGQPQSTPGDGEYFFAQKKGWNRKAVTTGGDAEQDANVSVTDLARGVLVDQEGTNTRNVGTPAEDDTGTELAAGTVCYLLP